MDILYLLVPLSTLLLLGVLGVFAWALHGGQFEDLSRQGAAILGSSEALEESQAPVPPPCEESRQARRQASRRSETERFDGC